MGRPRARDTRWLIRDPSWSEVGFGSGVSSHESGGHDRRRVIVMQNVDDLLGNRHLDPVLAG